MAVTENLYTGDGSTVLYSFTFEYLNTADIKVSLDDVDTTAYSIVNATQLQLNTAPASGVAIRIYRVTSDASLQAEFFPGSAIKSSDLNNNFTQSLYVAQETNSTADKATTVADSAKTAADSAVTTANTASTTASNAVTTANSAVTTANSAVSTANTASTTASSAVTTANSAAAVAEAASTAVASAVFYVSYANVAAIPSSPSNGDLIEVTDSTGIESFTPLTGLPSGFTGVTGLAVRLTYTSVSNSWTYAAYRAIDPESRYISVDSSSFTSAVSVPDGTASAPSFAFNSDTNTGIYRPGADQVAISTNGTGRLFVDASGNIGIGAASSGSMLDVGGTIKAADYTSLGSFADLTPLQFDRGNAGSGMQIQLSSAGYSLVATNKPLLFNSDYSNGNIQFKVDNDEKVRITSGGNVGIGVSSPSTTLDIASSSPGIQLTDTDTGVVHKINANSSSGIWYFDNDINDVGSDGSFVFRHGGTAVMTFSPAGTLTLGTGSGTIRRSGDTNTYINFTGSDAIRFYAGSGEALRVANSNVGIGTSTPSHALHVAQTAGSIRVDTTNDSPLYLNVTDSGPNYISMERAGTRVGYLGFPASGNDTSFMNEISGGSTFFGTNNSERMRVDHFGRVLINTSSARSNFYNSTLSSYLQLEGLSHNTSSLSLVRNEQFGGASYGPNITLGASGGSSKGSNTLISSTASLGNISFQGTDGSQFVEGALIGCECDGTPGANDMPGRLVFRTTADGAAATTERMRIDSAGRVAINTAAPQAQFHVNGDVEFGALNSQSVPSLASVGGCRVSWNYDAGAAETDFWNLYHNANISYAFKQKTGTATASEVLDIGTLYHRSYIGGTEKMRLDSTGLGIGTSSPGGRLDVVGGRILLGHSASGDILDSSTGSDTYLKGSSSINFQTPNGTNRMSIDGSNGRVGINTNSPSATLDVNGDVNISGSLTVSNSSFLTTSTVAVASYEDTTGGQNVNSTSLTTLTGITDVVIEDSGYSNSSGVITISNAGVYEIRCVVGVTGTTSSYRYGAELTMVMDGTTTVATSSGGYIRESSSHDETQIMVDTIRSVTANQTVEFKIRRLTSVSGNATTDANNSRIMIKRIR